MIQRFRELKGLLNDFINEETNVTIEEIEERTQMYYIDGELTPSQYDNIMGTIQEWI